jgi:hypothetical protein
MDRRGFLGAAALGAGALGLAALAGCGTTDGGSATGGATALAPAGIPETWDRECDVVVLGTGTVLPAAAYCAINGLETIVLEKNTWAGGETATAGGKCYVPASNVLETPDSRAEALAYLTACNPHEFVTPSMVEAYLDEGIKMIDFLKEKVNVNWQFFGTSLKPSISGFENVHGSLGVPSEDNPQQTTGKNFQQPQIDAITDAGGQILLSTAGKRLVARQLDDGRQEVLGVIALEGGKEFSIKARKGVVIGTGPYDYNRELCKQLLPYPSAYTWALDTCTGDGLLMALGVGAQISQTNRGWGIMPEIYAIDVIEAGATLPIYAQGDFNEKILGGASSFMFGPGSIAPIVSRMGQRFYKEPGNYSTMAAWAGLDAREETKFDYRFMPYSFGIIDAETAAGVGYDTLDPQPGWLSKGNTFEELADAAGIDKRNFVNTMARWQDDANNGGVDTEYGREGIRPLGAAPYYAVKVCQFLQSTVGGIAVNEKAQVKAAVGDIIPRLYATSTAASLGGIVYPGGGGSIGPGMAFAYAAGVDVSTLENWE